MKKLILCLCLIGSLVKADTGKWFGFTMNEAALGNSSYELTLYRYDNPVSEKDYGVAETRALVVCATGKYTVLSKSIENVVSRSSVNFVFGCVK
jgi:hypothetical protein